VPISLVDIAQPDLARFPKFEQACGGGADGRARAGDALYIPLHVWHGVQSLAPFHILGQLLVERLATL